MGDWTRAVCRGLDTEEFFQSNVTTYGKRAERMAKELCDVCPVKGACLRMAMAAEAGAPHLRSGIFGGLNPGERKLLAKHLAKKSRKAGR
jgi:hypothetical protein